MKNTNPIYLKAAVMLVITFFDSWSIASDENKESSQVDGAAIGSVNEHDIQTKGVLDRIGDNDMAIILIEELNEEIAVPRHMLPASSRISIWFDLKLAGESVEEISIDWQTTWEEIEMSKRLMEALRDLDI